MTQREIMMWYKKNLFPIVNKAIEDKKEKKPDLIYTVDWLISMAYRETWTLVLRFIEKGLFFENILPVVKGDYGQRKGETEKQYHGFGFWQIDIGSYHDFVKSGDWKDPYKCCSKAIDVLEEKKSALSPYFALEDDTFFRYVTAAYNCGQGRAIKALKDNRGVDFYTHEKNYSEMVWKYRELYNSLP